MFKSVNLVLKAINGLTLKKKRNRNVVVVEEEGNKKGAYVKKTSLRMTSFKFLRGLRRPVPIVTRRERTQAYAATSIWREFMKMFIL